RAGKSWRSVYRRCTTKAHPDTESAMRTPLSLVALLLSASLAASADPPPVITDVESQPLAANATRLTEALTFLGVPLSQDVSKELKAAVDAQDVRKIQQILDPRALFVVSLNPESRVKVARGPAEASLQQAGFVPVLIKVVNDSTVKKALKIASPQSGPRQS